MKLCGGKPSKAHTIGEKSVEQKVINFPFAEIKRLTGLELSHEAATTILQHLGFVVEGKGDVVTVTVPT